MKTTTLIIILSSFALFASAQNNKIIKGKVANLESKEKEKLDKIFSKYVAVNVDDSPLDEIHKFKNKEVSFSIPNVDLPIKSLTFINSEIIKDKVIPKNFNAKISLLKAINLPEGDVFALSIIDKSISGVYYPKSGEEWIFAPIHHILGKDFLSSNTVVFYKKSYFKDKSKQSCATSSALKQLRSANVMSNSNNYCRKLYVAIEGDEEWFNFHGFFGGYGAMFGIMNNVSNIYSSQLNREFAFKDLIFSHDNYHQ